MSDDEARTPGRSLGGRFDEPTDALLHRLNRSVKLDQRLWWADIRGSRAHSTMLNRVGLISEEELAALGRGLDAVAQEFDEGRFEFLDDDEDVHMAIERRLLALIGEPARKLHTGRSRNDQVMTDTLIWLRQELNDTAADLAMLIRALLERAAEGVEQPMVSLTHYQPAQVSSVAQWLLAHAAAAERSLRRLGDLRRRLDECPLGSGAVAGSYLPLDRALTAEALGFTRPSLNATQATGSRADLLDAVGGLAVLGTDLSRFGEELVLMASPLWGGLRLPDRLTTGSSLLPQKRNPDGAELIRGGGKLLAGDFAALSNLCSGLAGGYSKDLQYDKEILFRAFDRARDLIRLAALHVRGLSWDAERLEAQCGDELAALYLGDRLVREGVPFRRAHHAVGLAVRRAEEQGARLAEVLPGLEQELGEAIDAAALAALAEELRAITPLRLLEALATAGSASPQSCREQIAELRRRLAQYDE